MCWQAFKDELAVLVRQQEWLIAVKDNNAARLTDLLASTTETADDAVSNAASRDAGAVARAGPCAGFQSLKILEDLSQQATCFRACASKEDAKGVNEKLSEEKKPYVALLGACKLALGELRSAKSRAASAAEAAKKKKARLEEAEAKKSAKRKKLGQQQQNATAAVGDHAIFHVAPPECCSIPANRLWTPDFTFDECKPFVLTGVQDTVDDEGGKTRLEKFLKEFSGAFTESSLKALRVWLLHCLIA